MIMLFPRFIVNFWDGLKGDFNSHPEARSYIWLSLFLGLLTIALAVYAGFLGYPLYQEMLSNTPYPALFALIMVLIICGTIFTASQTIGMYIVEKRKHGVSRTNGGRIKWIAAVLLFMLSFDIFMNHGGEFIRNAKFENEGKRDVAGQTFVFARQGEIETIKHDIYKLKHPKEFGCKGHYACRSTCPLVDGGSAHDPSGSLTKYGRAGVQKLQDQLSPIEVERAESRSMWSVANGAQIDQIDAIASKKKFASMFIVGGLYIVMFLSAIALAALDLAFEDAAGVTLDYDRLEHDERVRQERINERRSKRKQDNLSRSNDRKIREKQAAQHRRAKRRAEYGTNNQEETSEIKYADRVIELEKMLLDMELKHGPPINGHTHNGHNHPHAGK